MNVTTLKGHVQTITGVLNQEPGMYSIAGAFASHVFNGNMITVFALNPTCNAWSVMSGSGNTECQTICNAAVPCYDMTSQCTTCSHALGLFAALPSATPGGPCGPSGTGTEFVAKPAAPQDDDGFKELQVVYYCFQGNTPVSVTQLYITSADHWLGGMLRGADDDDGQGFSIVTQFSSWLPGGADAAAFVHPTGCMC